MDLINELLKKPVAVLQIIKVRHPVLIKAGTPVVLRPGLKDIPFIIDDLSKMRIYMIIVLGIILMSGRRYKDRIQIEGIHSQILKIVQLV